MRGTFLFGVNALLLVAGCTPDLGECDMTAATQVRYDPAGMPAYAGQALINTSCGGGSNCHSEAAVGEDRDGAPFGLNFHLGIVTEPFDYPILRNAHADVVDHAGSIFSSVESRKMPPGEAGVMRRLPTPYVDDADVPLPNIDTPEGEAILRNWLACGAPVVDRIRMEPIEPDPVGDYQPARCRTPNMLCGSECVDVMIDRRHCSACGDPCPMGQVCDAGACVPCAGRTVSFATDVEPIFRRPNAPPSMPMAGTLTCTTSDCHTGRFPEEGLDLDVGNAYESLVGIATLCADAMGLPDGSVYVTAGDPDASYIVNKIRGVDICSGVRMPNGQTPLTSEDIRTIETWICDGALDN